MTKIVNQSLVSKFHLKGELKKLSGTHQIEVSPELAEDWLGLNSRNRPLSPGHVRDYVARMNRGEWCLNGQALIFSDSGELLDGQHRLSAVVEHGRPVWFDVRFGVDHRAFSTLDDGRKRTLGDNLALTCIPNYTNVAASVQKVVFLDREYGGNKYGLGAKLSNSELLDWYYENPHISEYVSLALKWAELSGRILTASDYAAHAFMMGRVDEELAAEFMGKLALGANLPSDSPVFKLRARLVQFKMDNSRKLDQVYRRALIIKAWNLYRAGKSVRVLQFYTYKEQPPRYED